MSRVSVYPTQRGILGVYSNLYMGRKSRLINSGTGNYVPRYTKPSSRDVVLRKITALNESSNTPGLLYAVIAESVSTFKANICWELEVPPRTSVDLDIWLPMKTNEFVAVGSVVAAGSEWDGVVVITMHGEVIG